MGAAVGLTIGGILTEFTAYAFSRPHSFLSSASLTSGPPSSQTWRSTFWFMTGMSALCCLGGFISIDTDVPYALPDK